MSAPSARAPSGPATCARARDGSSSRALRTSARRPGSSTTAAGSGSRARASATRSSTTRRTGALIQEFQLATGTGATFINDAVVTKKGVYFTDSQRPVIYKVARSGNGRPGAVTTIPLGGDYQHVAGQFNLNGIVATANGKTLIAVQTVSRKKLLTIDPKTGVAKTIDLGGYDLSNGDGLLLRRPDALRRPEPRQQGRRLRALARPDEGDVPAGADRPGNLDVPTTIDRFGGRLYVVNARFGTTTPTDQAYDIVRLS